MNSKDKISEKGFFISFEGPECAGKTTQITMLSEYLKGKGLKTLTTREPGGTEIGEKIRDIVKHLTGKDAVVDEAEVLLFAASRAQHVKTLIKPALANGVVVICDRFVDSTTAYQGYARGIDLDFVEKLNKFAIDGRMPDLTFVLDLPAEEIELRSSKRQETLFIEDRIESEALSFHRKVRDAFLRIASENPKRIKLISAMENREKIHSQIVETLEHVISKI